MYRDNILHYTTLHYTTLHPYPAFIPSLLTSRKHAASECDGGAKFPIVYVMDSALHARFRKGNGMKTPAPLRLGLGSAPPSPGGLCLV